MTGTLDPTADLTRRVHDLMARLRDVGRDPQTVLAGANDDQVVMIASGQRPFGDIYRTTTFQQRVAAEGSVDDGLNIEGHAIVFNTETEISGWEGSFREKIRPGATRKSIRERIPRMQFDHGHHPLLGGLPLGRWHDVHEDGDTGTWFAGRLHDNWLTEPFRHAIVEQSVDGMSFRFQPVREKWTDVDGKEIKAEQELFELLYFGAGDRGPITRELIEVKVAEAGPVVWPAYETTTVGVRMSGGERPTLIVDLGDRRGLAVAMARIDQAAARLTRDDMTAVLATADEQLATIRVHTDPVYTASTDAGAQTEPRTTEQPAADHPDIAPVGTGRSAGEHSSSSQPVERPANPTERSALLRSEYRAYLDRTLALPDH